MRPTTSHHRSPAIAALVAASTFAPAAAQQFVAEILPAPPGTLAVLRAAPGDLDGDGDTDLHLAMYGGPRWYSVLQNDGTGAFVDISATAPIGIGETTSAFVDFDGDGDDDLFVSMVGRGQLLRRVPGGFVDATSLLPPSPAWHEMIVGDLDGDGDLDLAGVGNVLIAGRNHVLRNDGPAGFTAIDPFPGLNSRIRAADVDGDGDLDVMLGPDQSTAGPRLLRNDGGMVFTDITATWLPAVLPTVNTFEFGDIDGDGAPDLVLGSTAGNDLLLRNTGTGFVAVAGAVPANAGTTFFPRFVDVDEDGDLDLWRGETTSGSATTTLALNDGTGTFTAAPGRMPPPTSIATMRFAADLDGDGDLDAVTSGAGGATILWNRHRHVSTPAPPRPGSTWTVELWSQPGYGTTVRVGMLAVGVARLPQRLRLPPFGTLWLDLSVPVALAPVSFAPGAGPAGVPFAIPALPSLVGLGISAQGLVEDSPGRPRLTSVLDVVIR